MALKKGNYVICADIMDLIEKAQMFMDAGYEIKVKPAILIELEPKEQAPS